MPLKPDHKTVMPHQAADERAHTFDEVNTGYTEARAQFEASRCLQCQEAVCEGGCPVRVPIKAFLRCVAEGRFQEAFDVVKKANPLPAICGRVCPQETQCELRCVRAKKGRPVAPAVYRLTMPKWLYSSTSSGAGSPVSIRRRMAPSPPTPGFPSQLKISFRATPPAIIWS